MFQAIHLFHFMLGVNRPWCHSLLVSHKIKTTGGLLWHVHLATKHFQPDFFFPGVCSGMSTSKPRQSTFSLISSSWGFALPALFLLPGGLFWHVHLQNPTKRFQRDFFFPGGCSGMSTSKPRRSTSSLISSSRGFALACPPPNPDEALLA